MGALTVTVFVTCGRAEEAERIARALVEGRTVAPAAGAPTEPEPEPAAVDDYF